MKKYHASTKAQNPYIVNLYCKYKHKNHWENESKVLNYNCKEAVFMHEVE